MLAVACVQGWRASVDEAMFHDARQTNGGDVVVFSSLKFSQGLQKALQRYPDKVRLWEMFTVARSLKGGALFCKLKAVEPGYPLYGQVPLASGRPLSEMLAKGLVVEARVLERLDLKVGDQLQVGNSTLPIVDVALSEPDRPLGMLGIAPRLFLASSRLDATALVRPASYVEHRVQIRLSDPQQAETVADDLTRHAMPDQERIQTWQQPPANLRHFVNNFFAFLDLTAMFAVSLGGLAMQSTLSTWLRERRPTMAILSTLGASSRFLFLHYALMAAMAALPGLGLGLLGSALVLHWSGRWLATLLPVPVAPELTPMAALISLGLGCLITVGFTAAALLALRKSRPAELLRYEHPPASWRTALLGATLAFGLVALLLHNLVRAAWFTLALVALLGAAFLLTRLALAGLRRWRRPSLPLRMALRSLEAPGASVGPIAAVLASSLAVLFTVILVEQALDRAWVQDLPADAPNLIFFDLQSSQADAFRKTLGVPVELYPSLRARIHDVDGKVLPRIEKRDPFERDNRREFRCSAATGVDPDEEVAKGPLKLFDASQELQVSALDKTARSLHLVIGSRVTFSIQGVPLTARVSSIRHEMRDTFRPTFDFIFPPAAVADAPQTVYAACRVAASRVGALQTTMGQAFPNVPSMDLSETVHTLALKLAQWISLIRFFCLAGAASGAVMLASASFSTRLSRMRDSAYLKLLGATRTVVSRVLLLENLLLGLLCSVIGCSLACLVGWGLCQWELEVSFPVQPGIWILMITIPTLSIALIGWLVSRPVINARPAPYLREDG